MIGEDCRAFAHQALPFFLGLVGVADAGPDPDGGALAQPRQLLREQTGEIPADDDIPLEVALDPVLLGPTVAVAAPVAARHVGRERGTTAEEPVDQGRGAQRLPHIARMNEGIVGRARLVLYRHVPARIHG